MVIEKILETRLNVIERSRHIVNTTYFWIGAIIYSSILGLLVYRFDSLGIFHNWMKPILYLCLTIMFSVSFVTLIRVLRKIKVKRLQLNKLV